MTRPEAPEGTALGSDPFSGPDGTIPYLIRLRKLIIRPVEDEVPSPLHPVHRAAPPEKGEPPDLGPPVPDVAPLEDRDELGTWLDRLAGLLLEREDEERIAIVARRLEGRNYDPLGVSVRTTRRSFGIFKLLYRYYFRVESSGHKFIPEKKGAILAGNHGGLLPFDAAMAVVDVVLRATPPRLVRSIVEHWAGTLPFVNVFFARVGQVIGTRENFRELLRNDDLVLVFPEGIAGIRKRAVERYVLQHFHVGFVEESLRNRVPIIPVAFVGADDQAPILYDIRPLAKLLNLPVVPVTPTFPLLGPLGLLPYPVRYEIEYGEPFRFYQEHPPDVIEDPHAVRYMAEQVKRRIQEMVDRRILTRRGKDA
jgi:1-acyl-sn-glycerol-3-phosphate acyltransferase